MTSKLILSVFIAAILFIGGCATPPAVPSTPTGFPVASVTPAVATAVPTFPVQADLQCVPGWEDCLSAGAEKLVFANQPEVTSKLLLQLKRQFGDDLQVVQSFPRYVELTHKDVSKGKAVAWLADRWGISQEEVLAIGDQDNDLSMVEWAGLGIAMGNAVEALKSVARHITLRAEEDGAAVAIEQFVLQGCDQD